MASATAVNIFGADLSPNGVSSIRRLPIRRLLIRRLDHTHSIIIQLLRHPATSCSKYMAFMRDNSDSVLLLLTACPDLTKAS